MATMKLASPLAQEARESTAQPSKDDDVFSLRQKATSAKNFAVLLILQHGQA